MNSRAQVFANEHLLIQTICTDFLTKLTQLTATKSTVEVGLTGGTAMAKIYQELLLTQNLADQLDWQKLIFWWSDERFVTSADPQRNDGLASEFFNQINLTSNQIHNMPTADKQTLLTAKKLANQDLTTSAGIDLALLSIGPDGHVASLFPGAEHGQETNPAVISISDSPKPPAQRLSWNYAQLNSVSEIWLIAIGAEKAAAVTEMKNPNCRLPAALVKGKNHTEWYFDQLAASGLV